MTFWVPRSPVVPQKQHMLRFGSLCDGLEQEPKIMILSYLGLWAFWCQKSNLSFKMWFFGLKSIKIISFDQKLHFVQKNCLKNALGRIYKKFNFGSFGHFWHFLLFSCLKVGWITQQNNEKIEPSKTRFYCGFLADIALIFTKNEFLMTFWVPRSPVIPQKQHVLRFGGPL